jgi:hypothetical protein
VINIIIIIVQKAAFKDVFLVLVLEIYVLLIVMDQEVALVHKIGLPNSDFLPSATSLNSDVRRNRATAGLKRNIY